MAAESSGFVERVDRSKEELLLQLRCLADDISPVAVDSLAVKKCSGVNVEKDNFEELVGVENRLCCCHVGGRGRGCCLSQSG